MNKIFDKNKTLIGLILMSVVVFIYVYSTRSMLSRDDIVFIDGTLKEKPLYGEHGGDMPRPYIRLTLKGSVKKFYLNDCGYYKAKREDILSLNRESKVNIGVRKADVDNNKIDICQLASNNNNLLDIDEYNSCYVTYWKYLLPPLIIMISILFYRVINELYSNRKNKNYV